METLALLVTGGAICILSLLAGFVLRGATLRADRHTRVRELRTVLAEVAKSAAKPGSEVKR